VKRAPADAPMLNWAHGPLALLCLAAFLAPLIGGTVSLEAGTLAPGYVPFVQAVFGGAEVPSASHWILMALVCASAAWLLVSRRVLQVPLGYLGALLFAFLAILCVSTIFSGFPYATVPAVLEWLTYGIAFFVAVAATGRRAGTQAVLLALLAGCALVALSAILEYLGQNDPTWRVFGTWQNPNALGGMLLFGLFVGIGLTMSLERAGALAAGGASALIGFALALTQSKGALLAAVGGLAVALFLGMAWIRGSRQAVWRLGRAALALIALGGLLAGARLASPEPGAAASFARVAQAGATQEQSGGFRVLLWRSAVDLAGERPLGWGIGAYRHESARPGRTTQTHFAHNSFLQLAAEAGPAAPAVLLLFLGIWTYVTCKGATKHPPERAALRVGLYAALAAAAAHNQVDSDLHFFGTGLAFFLLLGLGLQLSADGSTPETILPTPRWGAFAASLAIPLLALYFAAIEVTKAHARYHVAMGEFASARVGAEALTSWAPRDGEAWFLAASTAGSPEERLRALQRAAEFAPSTKNARAYARQLQAAGKPNEAASVLHRALQRDPHNLYTLLALLQLHQAASNETSATETARRMVEVESTSYFQVRALPELVPVETAFARLELAQRTDDPKERMELLEPAWRMLLEYAGRTMPSVVLATRAGMAQGFAGESAADAMRKMKLAEEVGAALRLAYVEGGKVAEAKVLDEEKARIESAIASLREGAAP
jgi:O-antigen ligase